MRTSSRRRDSDIRVCYHGRDSSCKIDDDSSQKSSTAPLPKSDIIHYSVNQRSRNAPDRWEPKQRLWEKTDKRQESPPNTNSSFDAADSFIQHPLAFSSLVLLLMLSCYRFSCCLSTSKGTQREGERKPATYYPFCICLFSRWKSQSRKRDKESIG